MKTLLAASVLCLLLIALFTVPTNAVGNRVEISYQFAGTIVDERNGMQGTFSMALSGRVQGTKPEMEQETSGNSTYGPYAYNYSRTEYWGDNITQFKAEIVGFHFEYRTENYQQRIEKWYSGQAFTGKLLVIWSDGSVSSYSVSLSPIEIARTLYQSSFYQESHDEETRTIYQWDPELMDWMFLGENKTQFGSTASGTVNREGLSIILNGLIKGKDGRYNGLLMVSEIYATEQVTGTQYWDHFSQDFEYTNSSHQFIAMAKFGPYMMTNY